MNRTADDLQRRRSLALGAMLLLVGFGAGFVAGQESTRGGMAPIPLPPAADSHAGHDHGPPPGGRAAPEAGYGETRGHTFTGNIQVPPHGPEGHDLAQALLAGAACPCGGCGGEPLLGCGCDLSREVEGLAAHLLERGRPREEVVAQLRSHYGLVVADASASPRVVGRAKAADPLEGLSGVLEGRARGPVDVPSSARPGSGK